MGFDVLEPRSIEEVTSLLSQYGEEARILAGGQSLLLMIRSALLKPRVLLSLGQLDRLAQITVTSHGNLSVGALATHREVSTSPLVRERAAMLVEAATRVGSTPVRNLGTIGGNLCHNEMGSDPPPVLLALEAQVECISIRGKREIPVSEFTTNYFETCIEPDEILVGIEIPPLPAGGQGVYVKHVNRSGDLAMVGVAAWLKLKSGICEELRLALGGVGPIPFRASQVEQLVEHKPFDDSLIEEAAAAAADMSDPISDAHASADYRRKMVRVMVKRALHAAVNKAQRSP